MIRVGHGSQRIKQTTSMVWRKVISLTRQNQLPALHTPKPPSALVSHFWHSSASNPTVLQVEISHFRQYESPSAVSSFKVVVWGMQTSSGADFQLYSLFISVLQFKRIAFHTWSLIKSEKRIWRWNVIFFCIFLWFHVIGVISFHTLQINTAYSLTYFAIYERGWVHARPPMLQLNTYCIFVTSSSHSCLCFAATPSALTPDNSYSSPSCL